MLASVLQLLGLAALIAAVTLFGILAFGPLGALPGALCGFGVGAVYVGLALDRRGG